MKHGKFNWKNKIIDVVAYRNFVAADGITYNIEIVLAVWIKNPLMTSPVDIEFLQRSAKNAVLEKLSEEGFPIESRFFACVVGYTPESTWQTFIFKMSIAQLPRVDAWLSKNQVKVKYG